MNRSTSVTLVLALIAFGSGIPLLAQNAEILETEEDVQWAKRGTSNWGAAVENQKLAVGDRVHTGEFSRALVKLSDLYRLRMEELTTIELTPILLGSRKPKLDLRSGALFLFSREEGSEIDIKTPTVNAALKGTQLFAEVSANGRTFVQVIEGRVDLSNAHGKPLMLLAGQAGEALPGQAPRRTAAIKTRNVLQWALYYPAVLDPDELHLGAGEARAVAASLAAYRSGDLLGALAKYPDREPVSASGKVYRAAVVLAVGRVDEARRLLTGVPANDPGRRALERMIAAVLTTNQGQPEQRGEVGIQGAGERRMVATRVAAGIALPDGQPETASLALAESYYLQATARLGLARDAAARAKTLSPNNGFAWTRLAELEFSFGELKKAAVALEHGLRLTPRNAQAHALHGFVLSGQNRLDEARAAFERAIHLDGALGNGWLGRGLLKIRTGDTQGGLEDLQTATTVEPGTSLFHSYLSKAFSNQGLSVFAGRDLALAKRLDQNDPTPWLYSALELQKANRTNQAIREMEQSTRLNDNRRLFRSRYLLDQDRSVREANLARIYQDAGMFEVAVREATRAVESDYTNASAHLFLANAFDGLRDPGRVELRHETAWFNELLLSNLLSPVGGGPLSQFVSQHEYSKLLQEDGLGASIASEYRSSSELRTAASVFGTSGNLSFGIDGYFRDDDGGRPNSDANLKEVYAQLKWQATPDDIVYFLGKWAEQETGEIFRSYENRAGSSGFEFNERQEPGLLLGGWNHRWRPGSHTLVLAGRLSASQRLGDPNTDQLLVKRSAAGLRPGFIYRGQNFRDYFTDPALQNAMPPAVRYGPDNTTLIYSGDFLQGIAPYIGLGQIEKVESAAFEFDTRRDLEIYTGEVQHILESDKNTVLVGGRYQSGEIDTAAALTLVRPSNEGGFSTPASSQRYTTEFERLGLYFYDYWRPHPSLTLVGGVAWDYVDHPDNFRSPPINDRQRTDEKLSYKGGFTWSPTTNFIVRGAATSGLGGLSFDESVRLEPVQLAGFNQSFRTVISESLVGSVETPEFQTWGLSMEGRLGERTWWGVSGQRIEQELDRTVGAFSGYNSGLFLNSPAYFADGLGQELDFEESRVSFTLNHLLGEEISVGGRYQFTHSELEQSYPGLLAAGGIPSVLPAELDDAASLHELSLYANWNSPTGWFARAEANWYHQSLDDDPRGLAAGESPRSGDEFWQCNAFVGYRFKQRQGEVSVGVLNMGDQDYRLSPLNAYPDIPHERTFVVRYRASF